VLWGGRRSRTLAPANVFYTCQSILGHDTDFCPLSSEL